MTDNSKNLSEEEIFLAELEKKNFKKYLNKLLKKLKDKKIIIYGAGNYFKVIKNHYDISKLNIIAISDRKYETNPIDNFEGYKAIEPDKIINYEPDYVLIATRYYCLEIAMSLISKFAGTNIKVKPLTPKNIIELLRGV